MSRAKKFIDEALQLIGEADDPNDLIGGGAPGGPGAPGSDVSPEVIDDTTPDLGGDPLDLGAEPEDEFGLGGATTSPTVKIEKDGPITVNKGDVQLSIGDDGTIDISLDGGAPAEPAAPIGDMTDKPVEGEPSPEEDDYQIDWSKEKEGGEPGAEGEEKPPKESLDKGAQDTSVNEDGNKDFEGQVGTNLSKQQSPATTGAQISKAASVLNMDAGTNSGSIVTECQDGKFECMSCGAYDECQAKGKKAVPEDNEADFLTQGYL